MIIEIRGTGTHNRGAELMAKAIVARLDEWDPGINSAVGRRLWSFDQRARYGLRVINSFPVNSVSRLFASFAPKAFRDCVGLVQRSEIHAVLDASGFAFGDQWGSASAASLVREMSRPWRRGQKLILLPQAFGPFDKPDVAAACRALFSKADLVYARDPDSLAAAEALGSARKLRLCPDFTALVPSSVPGRFPASVPFGAVVPNYRMLDMTSGNTGVAYLGFLARAVKAIRKVGLQAVVILHDADEDRKILPELFSRTGDIPVFESSSPVVLKGALGMAEVVIGSRYHALVSALSQATPCIGAGWSHKYKWLFEDYGCGRYLVENLEELSTLEQLVEEICASDARSRLIADLKLQGARQVEMIHNMWKEVGEVIGIKADPNAANET